MRFLVSVRGFLPLEDSFSFEPLHGAPTYWNALIEFHVPNKLLQFKDFLRTNFLIHSQPHKRLQPVGKCTTNIIRGKRNNILRFLRNSNTFMNYLNLSDGYFYGLKRGEAF